MIEEQATQKRKQADYESLSRIINPSFLALNYLVDFMSNTRTNCQTNDFLTGTRILLLCVAQIYFHP